MAEDSDLEKTEPASPRRLEKAREEGQVARSRELSTFALLAAGVAGLWMTAERISQGFGQLMRRGMQFEPGTALDTHRMLSNAAHSGADALMTIAPLLGLLVLAAILAPMALGGWLFTTKSLAPNFGRLNPLKGFGRMFSVQGLIELVKAIAKTLLVGAVAYWAIARDRDAVMGLMTQSPRAALPYVGEMIVVCCAFIVASLLLVAAIDVPFQLWQHYKKLRMTKEEVRQENKENEGDPHLKAHIRQLQRQVARRRMMQDVPRADVIVTNPTHFAVALEYKDNMSAPRVLAKGTDLVAQRIREMGVEHNIPILEAPPLARALHAHVEIGHEIPATLYTAVAEVLAWVFQLRRWRAEGGVAPITPTELPVPAELAAPRRARSKRV
ncbi:flagellar biosynthesis protein FlhB [Pandoraea pulmonicola]|uniref:Flagellar biosynthetic protein FlhB n=1 Tax=Pandoraea pulmonicola TaxID=93221 RepID=A0AAJ4ZD11_PANPU|nr:flagellar biosynthesis protein FlhB [Pandoraea pulmonicola]AJC20437.1 flagellar biosynthesis protein FlhB [Pandoraea pulmonicola]SUA91157.1 Flagellar biosynthetic protein flhB [Pandoraea pulmonicola]